MVCPENDNVPVLTVVHPVAFVDTGAVHPAGTAASTSPLASPPAAAVYMNTTVLPVELADTFVVGVVDVPDPFAAFTVTDGEPARFVSVPAETDFSCPCHVAAPVAAAAVAPSLAVQLP